MVNTMSLFSSLFNATNVKCSISIQTEREERKKRANKRTDIVFDSRILGVRVVKQHTLDIICTRMYSRRIHTVHISTEPNIFRTRMCLSFPDQPRSRILIYMYYTQTQHTPCMEHGGGERMEYIQYLVVIVKLAVSHQNVNSCSEM